jgi:hypothetical protein
VVGGGINGAGPESRRPEDGRPCEFDFVVLVASMALMFKTRVKPKSRRNSVKVNSTSSEIPKISAPLDQALG